MIGTSLGIIGRVSPYRQTMNLVFNKQPEQQVYILQSSNITCNRVRIDFFMQQETILEALAGLCKVVRLVIWG
jgi:hypothetical protein